MADEVQFSQEDVTANKGLAILMAFFPFLFFLPIVMKEKKDSQFLNYYVNSELLLVIADALIGVLSRIDALKWPASILGIFLFVLWIINIVFVAQAKGKKIPVLGDINLINLK